MADLSTTLTDALAAGAVAHCFTGLANELDDYVRIGLHIGITGWICDERRGLRLRDSVADVPEDRLMIETAAPCLLPRTISRKRVWSLSMRLDMASKRRRRSSGPAPRGTRTGTDRPSRSSDGRSRWS